MSEILRAVIYARFSSDMQREESIDAQVRACREHCNRRHYVVTNVYKDEAKSGKSVIGREGYNQMMADALEHKFDVIVFHKIDRNARNEFNYYSFKNTLAQLGITYEYAAQNIDFSPEGQMMENMLVGFAAYYSRNLAKETKKGLNENAYKAQFNGGTPPLGYRIENKHYVIDEHEAEAVRMIYSMFVAGHGYTSIANALAAKGFKTKAGRNFSKNSLFDILGNEKYIGTYTFNRVVKQANGRRNTHSAPSSEFIKINNAIPAIISPEVFYAVQDKRKVNRVRKAAYRAKETYLLSGKIFCGQCGGAMSGYKFKPRETAYIYYGCTKKERTPGDRCQQKMVKRDVIEKFVLKTIEKEIFSAAKMQELAHMMAEAYRGMFKTSKAEVDKLKENKIMAERRLNNIYTIIENGAADAFDLERLKATKAEIIELGKKIDSLKNFADCPELTEDEIICTLKALHSKVFAENDLETKKALIDLFVERVTINVFEVSLVLTTQKLLTNLVPRTGIEPVRVSLPEGF